MTTRERILHAALRVIGTDGVAGVTNRRVTREAEGSLGSLTYHFESQRELLREAMVLFVAEESARLAALADAHPGASVESAAALVERVAVDTRFGHEQIAPLELYLQAGRAPSPRDAAASCFEAYDRIAVTVLTRLGVPSPDRLAGPVVALLTGLQLRRLATDEPGATGIADAVTMLVREQ
ncbi:TetR/AcrR family transcriptional regulator [Actinophytocola glycyrrhizae]|uniref:TetR/AcrR family transcriptional regulator n=1 Tax=Actinophytocola glycyrrhizae TaxID=2044873 RepID=A0ABV9RZN9_9PSEU